MAIPLNINGAVFEYPVNFDENWGVQATGWAQAVTNGMLQRQGGNFPLTADANFGPTFGLISPYYKSTSANLATAGILRLSNADTIDWRNNANSANNVLSINSLDQLLYNGVVIGAAGGVTSLTGTPNEVIVSASTGAVTLSTPQAIGTSSSPTFATVTANLTGNVTGNVTGTVTGHSTLDLALTGGTMSGAIAMGANKITGLANGSAAQDAVAFTQLSTGNAITAGGIANTTITATQIANATITATQLAANAVTQVQNSAGGTSGLGAVTLASVVITGTGGPILVCGHISIHGTSNSNGDYAYQLTISRGSSSVPGGTLEQTLRGQASAVALIQGSAMFLVDTPGAGTFTYNLSVTTSVGTFSSAPNFAFQAIELKR